MTSDVVLTLARVIRDRSWLDQQMTVADDLAAELHRRAAERGLVISAFTDLAVVPSDSGTWARFTLGATAS